MCPLTGRQEVIACSMLLSTKQQHRLDQSVLFFIIKKQYSLLHLTVPYLSASGRIDHCG